MGSKGRGWRSHDVDGYEVLVGKGARDNDALTFGEAGPRDLWLHAAGYAGSHVIVRVRDREGGGDPPRRVIERAAELAAYHSKARDARGKVAVHVCRISEVRKPRGAPPGQVRIRRYEAVKVYPRGGAGD